MENNPKNVADAILKFKIWKKKNILNIVGILGKLLKNMITEI